jgi:hypothetical protein
MADLSYPLLYQINIRVRLTELSHALGGPVTLDEIPGADLDRSTGPGIASSRISGKERMMNGC